jgi:hypothetical protein
MKKITTQKQLDALVEEGIKAGEEVAIEAELRLGGVLHVYGSLTINRKLDSDWYEDRYVRAWGSATVEAWGSATVRASDSATVEASDSATVRASDSATVEAWDSATVEAWDSATVRASGSATVRAWDSATVEASGSATVEAWGSATVRASGSATVEAWDSATLSLLGFAIGIVFPSVKFELKSDFAKIVKRDQVFKTKKKTTVYKKLAEGLIATLELKKGQVFQSENNSKCRTDSALVVKIENSDGAELQEGYSRHDNKFKYVVGETVSAPYNEEIRECSTGIHFFLDRESAERYQQ